MVVVVTGAEPPWHPDEAEAVVVVVVEVVVCAWAEGWGALISEDQSVNGWDIYCVLDMMDTSQVL